MTVVKRLAWLLAHDDRGVTSVWVAMLLTGLVGVMGLSVDGKVVFSERRALQGIADGAALASAMELDNATYRANGAVLLDVPAAYDVAVEYLERYDVEYEVIADTQRVEVMVRRRAETAFVRILGINSVEISAEAIAEPRYGIAGAGG